MIVINGTVSDELKQHLLAGGTHPVAQRYANLIIAGGNFSDWAGDDNLWNSYTNPIEQGYYASTNGAPTSNATMLRTSKSISVEPSTPYAFECNLPMLMVLEFDAGGNFIKHSGWKAGAFTLNTGANTSGIKVNIRKSDGSALTVDQFEWLNIMKEQGD